MLIHIYVFVFDSLLLAGLWSLSYEQELTTPLHITASRGFAECLRLLLQRGADVDQAPGGSTALHESCERCQPECTKLLLIDHDSYSVFYNNRPVVKFGLYNNLKISCQYSNWQHIFSCIRLLYVIILQTAQ